MKKNQDLELERLEAWDTEQAQVVKPIKPSRLVVSVSFQREDFERISKLAELLDKKPSQFIRDAAINKTIPISDSLLYSFLTAGLGTVWTTNQIDATTLVTSKVINNPEYSEVLTS